MTHQRLRGKGERGMTLIEVLIASFILLVVTLAVLQLFSMALAENQGSLARTDLSYRCERVMEVLRLQSYYSRLSPPANAAYSAPCCPLANGTYTIPPASCTTGFWGPSGANVLEAGQRFTISYTVATGGIGHVVTVTAQPNQTGARYLGAGLLGKTVRYVAEIP